MKLWQNWKGRGLMKWFGKVQGREGLQMPILRTAFGTETTRNRTWYGGEVSELSHFYSMTDDMAGNTSFWAQGGRNPGIRKIHSGLPALMVDVLSGITLGDFLGVNVEGGSSVCSLKSDAQCAPLQPSAKEVWDKIAWENGFDALMARAVRQTLALGDGAFKISFDPELSDLPIIEFFAADRVRFNYRRGRIFEVVFLQGNLEEIYHRDGIRYRLLDDKGQETIGPKPEDITHSLGINLAVPLIFDENPKHEGRGKSIFDGKIHAFDALDETLSSWVDALRDGRVQKYIPYGLLPRNPNNGRVMALSGFESRFIQTEMDLAEGADNAIKVVQPAIDTGAYEAAYIGFLNLALQGVIAPATLGLDLKRNENAAAQREKEKATLYTRSRIIDGLRGSIGKLAVAVMATYDGLSGNTPREYKVNVEFGEYAAPDFGTQLAVIGKAVADGILSVDTAVEQLYGDTWSDEQKSLEVERLTLPRVKLTGDCGDRWWASPPLSSPQ